MSTPRVEPLAPPHLAACLELWRGEGMAHEPDLSERVARLVARAPNLSRVLLDGDRVIGCVLCSYNEIGAYVFRLVVHPEHRGRGLGTRLMAACEDAARSAGAAKVMLTAEPGVARWYGQQGYTPTDARFHFKVL